MQKKKSKEQIAVDRLIDACEPYENLTPWAKGRIPKHYKRLNIPMEEAIEIAIWGFSDAIAHFGIALYFTQALLYGACVNSKYKNITVCTTSQWGKSFTSGMIAIRIAGKEKERVYVAGGTKGRTAIIMREVGKHLQNVHPEIKNKLTESVDKVKKLQQATGRNRIGFSDGGSIEPVSFGDSFSDPLKNNDAVGQGGHYIIDEASLISDDAEAESGRSEWASDDGKEYLHMEISNPHNPGRFWENLNDPEPLEKHLIIWMDLRTALEEGSADKPKEEIQHTKFYRRRSQCRRYYLCELEDLAEESMFDHPVIDDSPFKRNKMPREDYIYYLGIDSAGKGKDSVNMMLGARTKENTLRLLDCASIKKENWVDGVTGEEVVDTIVKVIVFYNVQVCFIDPAEGSYIVESLAKRVGKRCIVRRMHFSSKADQARIKKKHYAAVYAKNKRAEMHLDLADLIEKGLCTMTNQVYECIKEAMSATKYEHTTDGKIKIIEKDKIKAVIGKSPDELDSAILCAHAFIMHIFLQKTYLYS